jgi:hypothetical protein
VKIVCPFSDKDRTVFQSLKSAVKRSVKNCDLFGVRQERPEDVSKGKIYFKQQKILRPTLPIKVQRNAIKNL